MKPIEWVGSSRKHLRGFPEPVKDIFGRAPLDVQLRDTRQGAKSPEGVGGASVMEIVEDHDRSAHRAIYTVRFGHLVYVLHAFRKKSRTGVSTPGHEMEVVEERLKAGHGSLPARCQR